QVIRRLTDPARKRQLLATLGRRLDGPWAASRNNPEVILAIESSLDDAETRTAGIEAAAATGDPRYVNALLGYIGDAKLPEEARVAAVEAIGRLRPPQAGQVFDRLIAQSHERKSSNAAAEAAVRTLPRLGNARDRLAELMNSDDYPVGLRREALR